MSGIRTHNFSIVIRTHLKAYIFDNNLTSLRKRTYKRNNGGQKLPRKLKIKQHKKEKQSVKNGSELMAEYLVRPPPVAPVKLL